jgi:hypothetical protein
MNTPTCSTCDAPLWPVAIHNVDRTIVRACPYCDWVHLMPKAGMYRPDCRIFGYPSGARQDRPYDYETDGGL